MSAFWNFIPSRAGGVAICLAAYPDLSLDINATSEPAVANGTGLVLSNMGTPNFPQSNLWAVGKLDDTDGTDDMGLGVSDRILAMTLVNSSAIDADAPTPASQVWHNNNSQQQQWMILSVR
ncbi:hypothetical protein [Sphingomonas sp. 37zxx]|uniref:hypothetical protein n=1 Tax=Sphingomonas sp. 37zxx TaxID=1550073 RepID=UPI0012E06A26|nr:hypothetical protein [Sphingomonas sp. 37zxx]